MGRPRQAKPLPNPAIIASGSKRSIPSGCQPSGTVISGSCINEKNVFYPNDEVIDTNSGADVCAFVRRPPGPGVLLVRSSYRDRWMRVGTLFLRCLRPVPWPSEHDTATAGHVA